jgi:hypothetical protein
MARTMVGIYPKRAGAENVVSGLRAAGFRSDEIALTPQDWDGWFQVTVAVASPRLVFARGGGSGMPAHGSQVSSGPSRLPSTK